MLDNLRKTNKLFKILSGWGKCMPVMGIINSSIHELRITEHRAQSTEHRAQVNSTILSN